MKCDYIVVGGGSAGCVAAARLVRDHGASVLLLEGGRSNKSPFIRMPAGSVKLISGKTGHVKHFLSEPQVALGGRVLGLAQAAVLGGGSSVNMMSYMRGRPADYDRWEVELGGGTGWNWEGLLPYFVRQESNEKFNDGLHGIDGPMHVSEIPYKCDVAHLFVQTMQSLGVPFVSDLNGGHARGVGYCQTTTHRGQRCSAADAYIKPLRPDPRLTVLTGATVIRLLFDGTRATGVEYTCGGRVHKAMADSEIVLTAGAFVSPKLLMLAGIGPAQHLRELGIDVRADLPGVGQNLQDHNACAITAYTQGNFGYFGQDKGWRMIANGLQYALFNSGPVTSNGGETMAFVNLDEPAAAANLQIYALGMMWPVPGGEPPDAGVTLLANLVRPHSRGSVRLASSNPGVDPVINPNWFGDLRDLHTMVRGVRYLREILQAAPLARIVKRESSPGSTIVSDAEIAEYAKKVTESNFHPVGTCRMGSDRDSMSVVGADLAVRGIAGLRVLDASVMPTIPGANTNATVMAVADRGIALMMGERETASGLPSDRARAALLA